jgi:hypothetical protein
MRDMRGNWMIVQSNGFRVVFEIFDQDFQTGEITGNGQIVGGRIAAARGRVDNTSIIYTIDWNNTGKGGQYSGHFDPNGGFSGVTVDMDKPGSQATWFCEL